MDYINSMIIFFYFIETLIMYVKFDIIIYSKIYTLKSKILTIIIKYISYTYYRYVINIS